MPSHNPQLQALEPPHLKPLENLLFDPENPRLDVQENFVLEQQVEILAVIAHEYHLDEIFDSIIAAGRFWEHEPLIGKSHGDQWIVVEGNRRLAAVKLLVNPHLALQIDYRGVPEISDDLRSRLGFLPIIESTAEAVWGHIGYKHVNGARQWDSIAKARYIARVHERTGQPLDQIAKTIGDRNATVARLYHGLKVLEQAQSTGSFDQNDRFNQSRPLAFTHLWTGLGYENTQRYLGITPESRLTKSPVLPTKLKELRNYCLWLYGSSKNGKEPYVKSQNPHLRQVDEVLGSSTGVEALENERPLDKALEAALGDKKLLRRALEEAQRGLKDARAYFPNGFEGEPELAEQIRSISKLAKALILDLRNAEDEGV